MAMRSTKNPPGAQLPPRVKEVARTAILKSLALVRSECQVTDHKPGDIIENVNLTLQGGGQSEPETHSIACSFGLTVLALAKEPAGKEIARFKCDYLVHYEIRDAAIFDSLTQKDIELFAAFNATLNAWPYARELVQSLSARMMLPPLVLPLFRPNEMIPPQSRWTKAERPAAPT